MKRVLGLFLVLGLGLAQEFKPSFAITGGTLMGVGVEASWNCLLYQPPVGTLKPTLDLGLNSSFDNFQGAFLMRYFYDFGQGVQAGAGLGLTFGQGLKPYLRSDLEYGLPLDIGQPLFVGGDLGTDFENFLAHLKIGVRF
ncbi:MAG: hypothetical protein ACUVS9_02435 [Thermaceae bacterium]